MDKKQKDKLKEIVQGYKLIKKRLSDTYNDLETLETKLDYLSTEEQFKLDNTPENLKNSERYADREEVADALSDIAASAINLTAECGSLVDAIADLLNDIDDVT